MTATASNIAHLFVKEIARLYEVPSQIISDKDVKFVFKFWSAMFQSLGTILNLSSAYHPKRDG